MVQENPNVITSVCLSSADLEDLRELVSKGIFTHLSDATRTVVRRGIEIIKKERGLA